jgi:hypothetical protein
LETAAYWRLDPWILDWSISEGIAKQCLRTGIKVLLLLWRYTANLDAMADEEDDIVRDCRRMESEREIE